MVYIADEGTRSHALQPFPSHDIWRESVGSLKLSVPAAEDDARTNNVTFIVTKIDPFAYIQHLSAKLAQDKYGEDVNFRGRLTLLMTREVLSEEVQIKGSS